MTWDKRGRAAREMNVYLPGPRPKAHWKRVLIDGDTEPVNKALQALMEEPPHGWNAGRAKRGAVYVPWTGRVREHLLPAPRRKKLTKQGESILEDLPLDIDAETLNAAPPEVQLAVLLRSVESLRLTALEAVRVWLAVGGDYKQADALLGLEPRPDTEVAA